MEQQNHSTPASPLAWLNAQRFMRLRSLQIGLVSRVGRELDLVMMDGRRCTFRRPSDVLSQAKVRRAFLEAFGEVIPMFSRRKWLQVAATILAAAQDQEFPVAA